MSSTDNLEGKSVAGREAAIVELLIINCNDPAKWYSNQIGKRAPFLGIVKVDGFRTKETSGLTNFISLGDAKLIYIEEEKLEMNDFPEAPSEDELLGREGDVAWGLNEIKGKFDKRYSFTNIGTDHPTQALIMKCKSCLYSYLASSDMSSEDIIEKMKHDCEDHLTP